MWIKPRDRLPELNTKILISCDPKGKHVEAAYLERTCDLDYTYFMTTPRGDDLSIEEVMYWMDIPKFPGE